MAENIYYGMRYFYPKKLYTQKLKLEKNPKKVLYDEGVVS